MYFILSSGFLEPNMTLVEYIQPSVLHFDSHILATILELSLVSWVNTLFFLSLSYFIPLFVVVESQVVL